MNRTVPGLSLLLLTVSPIALSAAERKLSRSQLPAAVAVTVDRETRGSTVIGFSTERERGKTVYEAETEINGHTRDLQIDAHGSLAEVEEEVPLASLPENVRAGLLAKAEGANLIKVESLTKRGVLVAYEAATSRSGRKGEVQVGPQGGPLKHQE